MTHLFDIESLPRHDGLCAECVDRYACPMPAALLERQQRPSDPALTIDVPSFEGHTLVWCPLFG